MLIYFWERETACKQGRGRERGRHGIGSKLQALSCQHRARCGARTHEPQDQDLSQSQLLNRLSHPGAPIYIYIFFFFQVGFMPSTEPNTRLDLTNLIIKQSRPELRSRIRCLTNWATQAPRNISIFFIHKTITTVKIVNIFLTAQSLPTSLCSPPSPSLFLRQTLIFLLL